MLLMSGLLGLVLLCAVALAIPWHATTYRPGRDTPADETRIDSVEALPAPYRRARKTTRDDGPPHTSLTTVDPIRQRATRARPVSAPLRIADFRPATHLLPAPPARQRSATDLGFFDPARHQIVILSEAPAPQDVEIRPTTADPGLREIVAGGRVLATLQAAELPEVIEVVWVMPDATPSGHAF